MRQYIFRRDDNSETVAVDFETMMQMDGAGFITLPDGVLARRCRLLETSSGSGQTVAKTRELPKKIISDALGFPVSQLGDFQKDRAANGIRGIEFVPDPAVPGFIQVHAAGPAAMRHYMRHRKFSDRNSRNGGGACLSATQLDRLQTRMLKQYPIADTVSVDKDI